MIAGAPWEGKPALPYNPRVSLCRLKSHQHLKKSGDFARAFRGGSRARSESLLVVVMENGLDHARLGLSVGKRIWKSAVRRNRVRRIFREAFRLSQHELPAGVDVVLIPGRPKLEPELETTRRELVQLCAKAHRRLVQKREEEARGAEAPSAPR